MLHHIRAFPVDFIFANQTHISLVVPLKVVLHYGKPIKESIGIKLLRNRDSKMHLLCNISKVAVFLELIQPNSLLYCCMTLEHADYLIVGVMNPFGDALKIGHYFEGNIILFCLRQNCLDFHLLHGHSSLRVAQGFKFLATSNLLGRYSNIRICQLSKNLSRISSRSIFV